ncbi:MAG TPA: DUF2911 domain-containing protein [Chitinophagaceae bacterium]|nr:DUF2911 domain-containing protein [Chitinophagaceae bacterium]
MRNINIIVLSLALAGCAERGNRNEQQPSRDTSRTQPRQENTVNPHAGVDLSPMDMSYFPPNYPQQKMGKAVSDPPLARIIYSRPQLQGRKLFRDVLKHGEPWRLGANEATELELFRDALIQGRPVKKGRYILYCIPQQDQWAIRLNSNLDSWGLKPDSTRDVTSFMVPVTRSKFHIEYFTIVFEPAAEGANILMAWDQLEARLPIRF